ncbi:MAG: hypothetical protein H6981_00190 [Gammaproteobacteria bacterium]|nr:hypothetical protein [Gammaproteobacteria bacterium]
MHHFLAKLTRTIRVDSRRGAVPSLFLMALTLGAIGMVAPRPASAVIISASLATYSDAGFTTPATSFMNADTLYVQGSVSLSLEPGETDAVITFVPLIGIVLMPDASTPITLWNFGPTAEGNDRHVAIQPGFGAPLGSSSYPDAHFDINTALDAPGLYHLALTFDVLYDYTDGGGSHSTSQQIVAFTDDFTITGTGVPEPDTFAAMLAGLLAWRRRAATA